MPSGFESFGNGNSEFADQNPGEQPIAPTEQAQVQQPAAERLVGEAASVERPNSPEGITDGSEILAKIDGVVMETREGGAESSEDTGDTERNLENESRMREIGRAAETQNHWEFARATLNRVKDTAVDVFGEVKDFAKRAAKTAKEHIREAAALVSVAAILAACGVPGNTSLNSPNESGPQAETTALAGEQANGLRYDYSHYADKEGKESTNAYDYSLADCYGDREATAQGIMDVAKRTPEALASYAFTILTPEEKAELDLTGKTMVEIDDKMSNDPDGGVLQQQIIEKLDNALNDKNTIFKFYKENDFETSSYVYFVDSNKDGVYSPDELHLGYADVKRNGSPQVDIMRPVKNNRPLASGTSSSGEWETASYQIVDINLSCGGQVNYGEGEFPPGVPYVDPDGEKPDPQPSTEPETQPATEWGKEGDPHGGPDVTYSDKVDPDAEVSKEQNDNTNKGDQGYVDDGHATPGSGSESNGTSDSGYASSNIVAPGASTEGGRLSGSEKQDDGQINGDNPYRDDEEIEEGQRRDDKGNDSQQQAQYRGKTPGTDNYSDEGEENPNNW